MTKKELLEAIKDMPEDAEIYIWEVDRYGSYYDISEIQKVEYNSLHNRIELC